MVETLTGKTRFKVFGSQPGSIAFIELEDVLEAIHSAEQMINDRFEEVYILDLEGKVHRPDDFHLLLKT
jgi:hypothetical protein